MSFQNPLALFWALPLFSAIIALYLLRMRRRDLKVPAAFLWPERTEEVRANALIQKLRPNLLMFMQLAAVALAVVAFAKPQTKQTGLAGEVTVLVIDTSASMQATDISPSRFSEAQRIADETIRSAKPTDRIALIEAGPTPKVVFALGSDTQRQLLALQSVKPTDAEADMGEALRLASALVGGIEGARIVLLSDGDFEPVSNFSRGKAAVVYRQIGKLGDNLAISALGIAETPGGRQLYCAVKNTGQTPLGGDLSFYADGKIVDSVNVPPIAPGQTWGRTRDVNAGIKVIEAKLAARDFLKADNYAVVLTNPGASLRVLIAGKSDPFLERALVLDPRVILDKAEKLSGTNSARYDIVIFNGIPEEETAAHGVLTLGRAGAPSPVTEIGSTKLPTFIDAEPADLLKGVDLHAIYVDRQTSVSVKSIGKIVAQTTGGPLVVTGERPGKRQVFVAFEPTESDWPLQFSFPIFVSNALDYLGGSGVSSELAVRPGVPFSVPSESSLEIKGDNFHATATANSDVAIVRDILRVGQFRLVGAKATKTAYSFLRSERESNIVPNSSLELGAGEVRAAKNPARFSDFWRPIILICLVLLGAEWWLFARRS